MRRTVSCTLSAELLAPADVELQVAVAAPLSDRLTVTVDGRGVEPVELATEAGGRLHLLAAVTGRLEVSYDCTVLASLPPVDALPTDRSVYLRPSRYAESDRLAALATAELGGLDDPAELLRAAGAWVGSRLSYVAGSSRGTDGAVDTLLAGAGVCRDYAHLVVALLRARDVPARLVSVYAPGLQPMDFHAVAEALVDDRWRVVDATLLAPRSTLVRIATGRDAADTAFLSSSGGELRLEAMSVSAVVDGDLPADDLDELVSLS